MTWKLHKHSSHPRQRLQIPPTVCVKPVWLAQHVNQPYTGNKTPPESCMETCFPCTVLDCSSLRPVQLSCSTKSTASMLAAADPPDTSGSVTSTPHTHRAAFKPTVLLYETSRNIRQRVTSYLRVALAPVSPAPVLNCPSATQYTCPPSGTAHRGSVTMLPVALVLVCPAPY
jgi:hypothetical protein